MSSEESGHHSDQTIAPDSDSNGSAASTAVSIVSPGLHDIDGLCMLWRTQLSSASEGAGEKRPSLDAHATPVKEQARVSTPEKRRDTGKFTPDSSPESIYRHPQLPGQKKKVQTYFGERILKPGFLQAGSMNNS